MRYQDLKGEALEKELSLVRAEYDEICKKGLKLDLSRGKPGRDPGAVDRTETALPGPSESAGTVVQYGPGGGEGCLLPHRRGTGLCQPLGKGRTFGNVGAGSAALQPDPTCKNQRTVAFK